MYVHQSGAGNRGSAGRPAGFCGCVAVCVLVTSVWGLGLLSCVMQHHGFDPPQSFRQRVFFPWS